MHAHCSRCDRTVHADYEHPRARKWAKVYFLLPIPFVPLLPIMMSDYAVMLPMLMVYMLGLGPVHRLLRDPALCDDCGAIVEPTQA